MTRISKKPEERKQEIMAAAKDLFLEQGYDQTSVQDIVKKIGVAQGTFYYHFASKDACLEEVARHEVAALKEALEEVEENHDQSPFEQLQTMMLRALELQGGNKNLMDAIHKESNAILHERLVKATLEAVIPIVARVVETGCRAKVFKVRHPRETTELMISALAYLVHEPYLSNDTEHFSRLVETVEEILPRILGMEQTT